MAEALVGGAFLSASLQVLFDRVATPEFKNFFSKQKFDDGLLGKLKVTLMALQVVLDDAEDKQITNSTVKDWLDELQHVVYQADDLLDEIATKTLRDKLEADDQPQTQSSTSKVGLSQFFDLMKQFLLRINCVVSTPAYLSDKAIESRLKGVIGKLEWFVEQKNSLKLIENVGRKHWQRQETSSLVVESDVYGRDNDKEKIMELLLSDSATRNQIQVIPIVGMGGMGKTILAQLVYNDVRVNEKFHMKAWVCVSDPFDIYMITKKIFDGLTASNNNIESLDQLQIKLKVTLAGKKILIVLDDVWTHSYNDWDCLSKPFRAGAQESMIIITTRIGEVASAMGTIPSHHLERLSFEDCWSLFAKHAFGSGDYIAHSDLESIGKQIVEKCKGLPLAVISLGGLLRSKQDIEEWKNILKSEIWDLRSDISPALRLSYHYLPSHLKRCFAHCSKFPKDYKFEKEKLVRLWIAEDLVQQQPKSNKLVEEEGNYYFHELLSMSFFQRLSDNNSYFVMHDLLHDLAQHISGKFCFRLDDGKPLDYICEKVRHFSYVQSGKVDELEKFKVLNEVKCLRTFIAFPKGEWSSFLGNKVLDEMLPTLRCLRVLSLSQYWNYELPQSIENLILLRYLDFSKTGIKRLPDSVTTLCNLQTIHLSYCKYLIELPVNMGKLINLRHLDIRETRLTEMPKQMSRLKDLQHLTNFVVGKEGGSRISELKELGQLRGQLHISGLQNVISVADALEANLKGKGHLERLELEWGNIAINTDDLEKERDILDMLEPHAGVKHLGIINYGHTRFPVWLERVHLFRDMTSLHLISCVNCYSLPSIGQLPFLKYLRIERMKAIRNVSLPPMLKALEIKECDALQSVEAAAAVASSEEEINNCHCRLEELRISDCSSLVEVSLPIAILKTLSISGCRRLEFPLLSLSVEKEHNYHTSIEELIIIESCDLLKLLWLGFFPKLRDLYIVGCINLETLFIPNEEFQNLTSLQIWKCPKMVSFGHGDGDGDGGGLLLAPNLTKLTISNCKNLKSLPQQMHTLLPSLQYLVMVNCPEVESFPDGGMPSNLRELYIYDCEKLMKGRKRWGLQTLFSLEVFIIKGKYEEQVLESFPEEWLLPTTLISLQINLPNLKSLNHKGLQHLTSLTDLYIHNCPKLQSLPEEGLPNSLSRLEIFHCPLLKPRCQRDRGEDWPNISRIPHIRIN